MLGRRETIRASFRLFNTIVPSRLSSLYPVVTRQFFVVFVRSSGASLINKVIGVYSFDFVDVFGADTEPIFNHQSRQLIPVY